MSQLPEQPAGTSPPTSADVARLAGVSRATVSYVLNDSTTVRISDPTRRRVREAARELGYVPHAAARSLRAGRTRMVLLPAPCPADPLHQRFLTDLQTDLRRLDYTVVQYGTAGRDADEAARSWAELRPVAVVSPGGVTLTPRAIGVLTRSGAKAVLTLGPQPVDGAHALVVDQREVGHCAIRHLLSRGRRRIGVVVPREPGHALLALPRLAGARRAVEESGVDARIRPLPLRYEEASAQDLASRWPGLGLDAVFAYDDEYAMLLTRALQDAGVEVPARTAVIGAGDLMLGRLLRPRLSSVRMELATAQPPAEMIDRLVHRPGGPPERHYLLRAAAVVRESS
ncbi:LacI family DNA-binding transcriptional regulator [Streptomyces sp. NPDC005899]|uniref:LacI family DNA-binding transcriptional regulator n=1 Tax=Streptomyces sp. NPDC005899 TaxID=3155716 RepID=UPI0033FBB5FA